MTHQPSQPVLQQAEVQEDVRTLVQLPAPPEVLVLQWAEVLEEVPGLQDLGPSSGRSLLPGLLRKRTSSKSREQSVHSFDLRSYQQVTLLRGPREAAGLCRTGWVSSGAAGSALCWCLKGGSDAHFLSGGCSQP